MDSPHADQNQAHPRRRTGIPMAGSTAALLALCACTTFETVSEGPRIVHLAAHAQGQVASGYAPGDTMAQAARLTRERGYAYFRMTAIRLERSGENNLTLRTSIEMSHRREAAGYLSVSEVLAR